VKTAPVCFSCLDERGKLFQLGTADGRLHLGRLQVVAEVGVDVLVVVAGRQLAELLGKTLFTGVVPAGGAPAVTTPVTEGFNQPLEGDVIGVDRPTFTHGHVMGRIEAGGTQVPDGAGVAPCTALKITGTKSIAVVFNKPETVPVAECPHGGQIEGIAEGMGHHHRPGPLRQGCIQTGDIQVVGGKGDIDEDGNSAVLHYRGDRGGESGRNGDDFISGNDALRSQLRRGERHECQQVGGRSRIGEGAMSYAEKVGKLPLEALSVPSGGEPEIQGSIDQVGDFPFIEHPAAVGDAIAGREWGCRAVAMPVMGKRGLNGLPAQRCLPLVPYHGAAAILVARMGALASSAS
jgi:hypothetical protein